MEKIDRVKQTQESDALALTVFCPVCDREPGKKCVSPSGQARFPHGHRYDKASSTEVVHNGDNS